ncbi:hypothetical protein LSTR_LSTR004512 [Laodelphax striatellus]|uniref:Uncharacterized protein n=1 Tax=Laodelphax striatellus TaxID=195883 RepID=A0A482XGP5_LAOST|nr:hypothetical protein LSTR_LSTR004512 [Laodelphax striatellus]
MDKNGAEKKEKSCGEREELEEGSEIMDKNRAEKKEKSCREREKLEEGEGNRGGTPAVAHPPGTHTATGAPSKAPPQFKLICRNTSHIPAAILALPNAVLVTFAASLPPE